MTRTSEGKPKGLRLVLTVLSISVVVPFLVYAYGLMPMWECGSCHNDPNLSTSCPYCDHRGKQGLWDRLKYDSGRRGGGWLQGS